LIKPGRWEQVSLKFPDDTRWDGAKFQRPDKFTLRKNVSGHQDETEGLSRAVIRNSYDFGLRLLL
jgi:hypothetical protein